LHVFADEFAAHVGNVNCLSLGHMSGRVMVSGGDDKKVNMWAIGKPTCILVSAGFQPCVVMYYMYMHTVQNVCRKTKIAATYFLLNYDINCE